MKLPLKPEARLAATVIAFPMALALACSSDPRVADFGRDAHPDAGGGVFVGDPSTAPDGAVPEQVLSCVGTTCPYPLATCVAADGTTTEKCGVDLRTDPNHCGRCGNVCPTHSFFVPNPGGGGGGSINTQRLDVLHITTNCVDGVCVPSCFNNLSTDAFTDCNGSMDDGCETDLYDDPNNCGACGNKCADGVKCWGGVCGCPAGLTDCSATTNWACVDLDTHYQNCGACGVQCDTPVLPAELNQEYACDGGECAAIVCKMGWGDCDGRSDNGCETSLTDAQNCAACGNACREGQTCAYDHAYALKCLCDPGETLCPNPYGGSTNGCSNLDKDVENCGACNNKCPGDDRPEYHQRRVCRSGACDIICADGWGDCDGIPTNGCETNLMISSAHCGACHQACDLAAGQPCVGGQCLMVSCGNEVPQ